LAFTVDWCLIAALPGGTQSHRFLEQQITRNTTFPPLRAAACLRDNGFEP